MKLTSFLIKALSLIAVQRVLVDAMDELSSRCTKSVCDFAKQSVTSEALATMNFDSVEATVLKLKQNKIADLPQSLAATMAAKTLKNLDLTQNQIGPDGFGLFTDPDNQFVELETLNIAQNKVSAYNRLHLPPSLIKLIMNSNKIQSDSGGAEVQFAHVSANLELLSLRGCQLTFAQIAAMQWDQMPELKVLNIDGTKLPTDFGAEPSIEAMVLPKTLTSVIVDPEFLVKMMQDFGRTDGPSLDLPELTYIGVTWRQMNAILRGYGVKNKRDFQMKIYGYFKKSNEALLVDFVGSDELDLSGLHLTTKALVVAGNLGKRTSLKMPNNQLVAIPRGFVSSLGLKTVLLQNNQLTWSGVQDLVNGLQVCETLNLASNNLGDCGRISMPPSLEKLVLNGNKPMTIKFGQYPANLKVLFAQNMDISMRNMALIDFSQMPRLEQLYIDGNYPADFNEYKTTINIGALQNLQILRIDYQVLNEIIGHQTMTLPALKTVQFPRPKTLADFSFEYASKQIKAFFGDGVDVQMG